MSASDPRLQPPADYAIWWWVVAAVAVIGLIAVVVASRRLLRALHSGDESAQLERLRESTLVKIETQLGDYRRGQVEAVTALHAMSRSVRRFVGLVEASNVDFVPVTELHRMAVKDPRMHEVAQLCAAIEAVVFAAPPRAQASASDVEFACAQACEVVRSWR